MMIRLDPQYAAQKALPRIHWMVAASLKGIAHANDRRHPDRFPLCGKTIRNGYWVGTDTSKRCQACQKIVFVTGVPA